jgi:hypothetical protein
MVGDMAASALARFAILATALIQGTVILERGNRQDILILAGTSWRCITSPTLNDPSRQGYMYFHPDGLVKMAQVVPASNRDRPDSSLWWRTREDYDDEDPTGRKWTDLDWLEDDAVWASRRNQTRVVYGSPPLLMILSVPTKRRMHARLFEVDGWSRTLVKSGAPDPFSLTAYSARSRSTMTCELRPGWLQ